MSLTTKKRIAIFGSLEKPLAETEAKKLHTLITSLLDDQHIILVNSCGMFLGEYVNTAAYLAAEQVDQPFNELCICYPPVWHKEGNTYGAEPAAFHTIGHDVRRLHMIDRLKPDLALFIGGKERTMHEFRLCEGHKIPALGIRTFGGSGKDIATIVGINFHDYFSGHAHYNKVKGRYFTMQEHCNVNDVIDTIYAIIETE